MINTTFLQPRNLLIIAAISLLAHFVAQPLYRMLDGGGASDN